MGRNSLPQVLSLPLGTRIGPSSLNYSASDFTEAGGAGGSKMNNK